jgi:hypothetical protein
MRTGKANSAMRAAWHFQLRRSRGRANHPRAERPERPAGSLPRAHTFLLTRAAACVDRTAYKSAVAGPCSCCNGSER